MLRNISLCAVALIILVGSYYWLKPSSPQTQQALARASNTTPALYSINITNGNVTGDSVINVALNQNIDLRIHSDQADEAHLHGYDLSVGLLAGETQSLKFTASQAGRFTIELHTTHREIAVLIVQPNIAR